MNPYILIAIGVAWAGSLVGVGYWQNEAGAVSERTVWQSRENKEVADANKTILKLTEDARAKENKHAQILVDISKDFQKELKNVDIEKDKFIAGVRNGAIVLRQPATRTEKASGGITSEAIAAASGRNDEAGTKLSDETAEFLYTEATRADKVVEQLAACQAIVIEDRKLCNSQSSLD